MLRGYGQNIVMTRGEESYFIYGMCSQGEVPSQLVFQRVNINNGTAYYLNNGWTIVGGIRGRAEEVATIGMDGGRTAAVWVDFRNSTQMGQLYYQIFSSSGYAELAVNGEPLAIASDSSHAAFHNQIKACSDGFGGFFCAFYDNSIRSCIVRVAHINAGGGRMSDPEGNLVYDGIHEQFYYQIVPDGVGGCYVGWSGYVDSQRKEVYLMRLDYQCRKMWNDPMILSQTPMMSGNELVALSATSDSGSIALWMTQAQLGVRAAKVQGDRELWSTLYCEDCFHYRIEFPVTISDSEGGIYTLRKGYLHHYSPVIAQHLSSQGAILWGEDGIHLTDTTNIMFQIEAIPARDGGLYAVWREIQSPRVQMKAQRLSAQGELLWPEHGLDLSPPVQTQYDCFKATKAGNGNLFALWSRSNPNEIRGNCLDPEGNPVASWWQPEEGGLVADTTASIDVPIAIDGGDRIHVVWKITNSDPAENCNLQAQLIEIEGSQDAGDRVASTPAAFSLAQNYPNPFNPNTTISFDLPQSGIVSLKVFDILGREAAEIIHKKMSAGSYSVAFNAHSLPSGVYIYKMEANGLTANKKMILLR